MTRGTVKQWNKIGYAFVVVEKLEQDVFLHINDVRTFGIHELNPGDQIEFDLNKNPDGRFKATNARLIEDQSNPESHGDPARSLDASWVDGRIKAVPGVKGWLKSKSNTYWTTEVVCRLLSTNEFRINVCHPVDSSTWHALVSAPRYIAGSFDLDQEILVLVSEWPVLQHRSVNQIEDLRAQYGGRLAQRLVLLFHKDNAVERKIPEYLAHKPPYTVVAISLSSADRNRGRRFLHEQLRNRLGSIDLFEVPVPTADQFFGRIKELGAVQGVLSKGGHVGLFGTRKVGKTALLYRLQEELRRQKQVASVYLDVSAVDASQPNAVGFLRTLSNQLSTLVKGINPPDRDADISDINDGFTRLFAESASKIVILIDEIERMWPFDGSSPWAHEFVRAWRILRTHAQQNPGKIQFVITGRNPTLVESQRVLGEENPVFEFFSTKYLAPLTTGDSWQVITGLGRQMGLSFHAETKPTIMTLTGGHPKLIRLLGSALHRRISKRPSQVTSADIRDVRDEFGAAAAPTASEIVDLLAETYPTEHEILLVRAV